ncbi:MAG: hypothetical protein ACLSD6_06995 [Clostridium sp.]
MDYFLVDKLFVDDIIKSLKALKNWQNDKIHKKHLKNVQVLFIMEEKQKS